MSDRAPHATVPPDRALYLMLEELDRLESLLEEMDELRVSSRDEAEARLAALNREVDERSDA